MELPSFVQNMINEKYTDHTRTVTKNTAASTTELTQEAIRQYLQNPSGLM